MTSDVRHLLRWYVKKGARLALAGSCGASGFTALHNRLRRRPRLRVLTYHRFGDSHRDAFCVALKDFERQMEWVARRGLAVSLADVQGFIAGTRSLPSGSILVTVDDGCPSLFTQALPVMRDYRIPAVAFVPAGELSATNQVSDESPDSRMSWHQLDALIGNGITIGSHSWEHRSLGRMASDEIREHVLRSREELERRTGQTVTSFAYPFGTRADYNGAAVSALRESGYHCAFTSRHGAIGNGADPFTLPRIKVEGGEPLWMFRLLVQGAMDEWQWVDRTLWRLQARGA